MNAQAPALFNLYAMEAHTPQSGFRIFGGQYPAGDVRAGVVFVVNRNRQGVEIDALAVFNNDLFDRTVFDEPRFAFGAASFVVSLQQPFFVSKTERERQPFFCADEVAHDFHRVALDILEGQRWCVDVVGLTEEFTNLVAKVDLVAYGEQLATLLQDAKKVS